MFKASLLLIHLKQPKIRSRYTMSYTTSHTHIVHDIACQVTMSDVLIRCRILIYDIVYDIESAVRCDVARFRANILTIFEVGIKQFIMIKKIDVRYRM